MSKIIAIEAGHGFNTPGKRCLKSIDPNETREWWLSDRIVRYASIELEARYTDYSIVRLDDPTGATDVSLNNRTYLANYKGADVLVSIHADAGIAGGSGGGITAIRQQGVTDPNTIRLQDYLYEEVIKATGLKGNRSQPKREMDLHMTRESAMPACLMEMGFMDSTTDVPIILSDSFARQAGAAIAIALGRYLGLPSIGSGSTPTPPPVIEVPPTPSPNKIDIFYQVAVSGRGYSFYDWVKNLTDYAGDKSSPCCLFQCYPSEGELFFQVSPISETRYYPEVQNYKSSNGYYDYAGLPNVPFDKIQIRYSNPNRKVRYRAMCNGSWLSWIENGNTYKSGHYGYAGLGDGTPITAVEVEIV